MHKTLTILAVLAALLVVALPTQAQTTVTDGGDSGPGTLRDAIAATASGGTIDINVDRIGLLTQLTINKDLTINGNTPGATFIVQTGTNQRVMQIDGDVTLNNVVVTGGNLTGGNGGGILHGSGTLTLNSVTVTENNIEDNGVGIHTSGNLIINDSSLLGNTALASTGDGGGLFVELGGSLTMSDSVVHGNGVGKDGGGIYYRGASGTVQDSLISGNFADSSGGGIYATSLLSIQNSAISDNNANGNGAGVGGGPYDIDNTAFTDNVSSSAGGALAFAGTGTTLDNSLMSNNTAVDGGGMFVTGGAIVTNTRIVGNTATGTGGTNGGGGIFNRGTLTLVNTLVSGNAATGSNGGGINQRVGDLTLLNATVAGNSAAANGGGLWQRQNSGPATSSDIQNSIIYGNTATGTGDDVFLVTGAVADVSYSLYTASGTFNSTTSVIDSPDPPDDIFFTLPSPAPSTDGDLRLEFDSQAIDAGDDNLFATLSSPPTTDLIATSRELDVVTVSDAGSDTGGATTGAIIDMGAYEMGDCVLFSPSNLQEDTGAPTNYTVTVDCGTSDFSTLGGVFGVQVDLDDLDTGDYALQNSSNPWTNTAFADSDTTNPLEAVNQLNGITGLLEYGASFTAPDAALDVPGELAGVGYNTVAIEDERYEGAAEPVQTITCELFNLSNITSTPLNASCSGREYVLEDLLEGRLDTSIRLESDGDLTPAGQFNNATLDLLSDPDDSNPDVIFDTASSATLSNEGDVILPAVNDFSDIADSGSPLGLLIGADGHVPCVALNNASGYPMLDLSDTNVLDGFAELVAGDADGDFVIDDTDRQAIVDEFGNPDDTSQPEIADINGDGNINVLDLAHVGRNFGEDYSAGGGNDNLPACGPLHLYIVS